MENLKIFISWSGPRSQGVAEALHDWLPNVLQNVKPWLSANDIDKGAKWRQAVTGELEKSNFGLICLTPENLTSLASF
jgi:TIR domain